MLDLAVEFDTLITHGIRIRALGCCLLDVSGSILFIFVNSEIDDH